MEYTDQRKWYCLRTQPKHEHIAAAHLHQIPSLETLCPRLRFQRLTSAGSRWFVEAMFPGYLFARFEFAAHHRQVSSCAGVSSILRFGTHYASIPETVIEELRQFTGSRPAAASPELAPGHPVRITSGALRGQSAVITEVIPGKERVRILIELLGRTLHTEVPSPAVFPEALQPASL